jgi:nonsense-mediated mRNA decay protein 3
LPGGEAATLTLTPQVSLERTLCRACGLRRSDFYEAILQVRADDRAPGEEELEAVDSVVLQRARAADPTSLHYVAKVIDRKEGRDYFLASVAFARELAREILSAMGGSLLESGKLVGVEKGTGKKLYKFTILARLPRLRPGDVVEAEGNLRAVAHQSKERTTLIDLRGRRTTHEEGRDPKLSLVSRREDVGEALVLEVRPDGIQILDPRSNRTFDMDAGPDKATVGRKVKVVWREDVPELAPVLPEEEG